MAKILYSILIMAIFTIDINAYCIRICIETNSMSEASQYIESIKNKMDSDVSSHVNSLYDEMKEYNDILKKNVLMQRKWTTYLAAEVLDHKRRVQEFNKNKALTCLYADTYIVSIQSKIIKLEAMISNLQDKINKENSKALKNILTNNYTVR